VLVEPGDEIGGRYRLEGPQGRGAMSEVWRARDLTLDRTVALKVLAPTADLERFRREARAVAALGHENVVRVFDYGEDEARPFIALEWLSGGTLEARLMHGALPFDAVHNIAMGMAAGLAHLHSRGVVHRDLKPANVLFDDEGRPKLADFGIARHAAGYGTLTEAGTLLGTAAYMSPEQAAGEPAGPPSDVYAFGVTLFQMLTGVLPFEAENALAVANMHLHEPPPDVTELRPDAPPELAALTAATLQKNPADRPADGAALLAILGAAPPEAELTPAEAEQTVVLPAVVPVDRRTGRRVGILALGLVILAGAGGLLAWAVSRPGPTGLTTGPVAGTKSRSGNRTTQSLSQPGATSTRGGTTGTRTKSTTTAHTTTAAATTRATTRATTTTPTTTATQSTTTATSTTTPTTTSSTTTTTPTTSTATTTPATTNTTQTGPSGLGSVAFGSWNRVTPLS
jgi:eukaryotic-like serine/threonine-protein kinase